MSHVRPRLAALRFGEVLGEIARRVARHRTVVRLGRLLDEPEQACGQWRAGVVGRSDHRGLYSGCDAQGPAVPASVIAPVMRPLRLTEL